MASSCKGIIESDADATIISGKVVEELQHYSENIVQIPMNKQIILELPNGEASKIEKAFQINITLETKLGQLIVPH